MTDERTEGRTEGGMVVVTDGGEMNGRGDGRMEEGTDKETYGETEGGTDS